MSEEKDVFELRKDLNKKYDDSITDVFGVIHEPISISKFVGECLKKDVTVNENNQELIKFKHLFSLGIDAQDYLWNELVYSF